MKIIGRYYLLCDACNWEFTGFALPGTVSSKVSRVRNKNDKATAELNLNKSEPDIIESTRNRKKIKKRIKAKF